MKLVFAMLVVFFVFGATTKRITSWTVVAMFLAILSILVAVRLTF